jgi:hypothetical protein
MRRALRGWFALFGFALTFGPIAALAHPATITTNWTLRSGERPGHVQIELSYASVSPDRQSTVGWSGSLARPDLAARLQQPSGPTHFTIVREAGTFDCVGVAGAGSGSGQFTFSTSPAFAQSLARRGMEAPTTEQSLRLALSDVTLAYIDALPQRPRPTISDILRAADHGVSPEYVRVLASAGYPDMSLETLARLRDHGVTSEFIAKLRASGYTHLSAEDLIRLSDHGVRPEFIVALQATGYRDLSPEDLARLVDHGVRAEFVRDLAQRGYHGVSTEDLIRLADHGVTVAFIDRLQAHGYAHLTPDELIRLRDSGL